MPVFSKISFPNLPKLNRRNSGFIAAGLCVALGACLALSTCGPLFKHGGSLIAPPVSTAGLDDSTGEGSSSDGVGSSSAATADKTKESAPALNVVIRLNEENVNQTIEVHVGDHIEIRLPGNPTTGYNWRVSSPASSALKQIGEPEFQADSKAIGSGGYITSRFEALKAGVVPLQLAYRRSSKKEKENTPLSFFDVTIMIK